MTIIKFPSKKNKPPFFIDIKENGYHIFSLKNAKMPGYYPSKFPEYPGVDIKDLQVDDFIAIRVFFGTGKGKNMQIDGGYLDLKIEHIDGDTVLAVILTELSEEYPLKAGGSLEIFEDEILYKAVVTVH